MISEPFTRFECSNYQVLFYPSPDSIVAKYIGPNGTEEYRVNCTAAKILKYQQRGDLPCIDQGKISWIKAKESRHTKESKTASCSNFGPSSSSDIRTFFSLDSSSPSQSTECGSEKLIEGMTNITLKEGPPLSKFPGYVVNIPLKVDSDDEGESSEGEETNNFSFPPIKFQKPENYFRLLPKEDKSSQEARRGKLLSTLQPKPTDRSIQGQCYEVVRLLSEEAHSVQSPQRIALTIGLNRMRSLSKRKNDSLQRQLNQALRTDLSVQKIAFLWDGVWQQKINDKWSDASYEKVHDFYQQLKKKDPALARSFREKAEEKYAHMIPYREIRDRIKGHNCTRELVRQVRDRGFQDIYLLFLDGDIRSFHHQKNALGAFTIFDEHYRESRFVIGSTGYTIKEPDNLVLEVGVLADMAVRQSTADHIKNGIYYPEPCTAIQILPDKDTILEKFRDPKKPDYTFPNEMPRLIKEVLKTRKLQPNKVMVFDTRGAIVTTTPKRMERSFSCRSTQNNGIILWGLPDFKTMRGINQSHFKSRNWALNLLPALDKQTSIRIGKYVIKDKKVINDVLTSLLSRLFKAFDPIELAKLRAQARSSSFQIALIEILHDYVNAPTQEIPVNKRQTQQPRKIAKDQKKEMERAAAVQVLWEAANQQNTLKGLLEKIRQLLVQDCTTELQAAANQCGSNLAHLFKQRFCLDYETLVLNSLSNILKEPLAEIEVHIPPIYKKIICSNAVIQNRPLLDTKPILDQLDLNAFHGISPLHITALAGNLEAIKWIKENCSRFKLHDQDRRGLFPFFYAIIHCIESGFNQDLLAAVCTNEILSIAQQMVCENIDEVSDQVLILDYLLTHFNSGVIQNFDENLLITSIEKGYVDLVRKLLDQVEPETLLTIYDNDGDPPIITAIKSLNGESMYKMLEYLCDDEEHSQNVVDELILLGNRSNEPPSSLHWVLDEAYSDELFTFLLDNISGMGISCLKINFPEDEMLHRWALDKRNKSAINLLLDKGFINVEDLSQDEKEEIYELTGRDDILDTSDSEDTSDFFSDTSSSDVNSSDEE